MRPGYTTPKKAQQEVTFEDLDYQINSLNISPEKKQELLNDLEEIKVAHPRLKRMAIAGLLQTIESIRTPSKEPNPDIPSPNRQDLHDLVDACANRFGAAPLQHALETISNIGVSVTDFFEKRRNLKARSYHNKSSGVQSGAVVSLENGEKYYVKTYQGHKASDRSEIRLDPRELFVYKVLELTGFGQKVEFIKAIKSGHANGIYIATLDASYTTNKSKSRSFKTITKFEAEGKPEVVQMLIDNDRKFATESVALETLDKVFGLTDTFTNSGNYGVVEVKRHSTKEDPSEVPSTTVKPKLIDFRIADNFRKPETPFTSRIAKERLAEIQSDAIDLILRGKDAFYNKTPKTGKSQKLGIRDAVKQANEFIKSEVLHEIAPSLLIDDPATVLDQYTAIILDGISRLESTERSHSATKGK